MCQKTGLSGMAGKLLARPDRRIFAASATISDPGRWHPDRPVLRRTGSVYGWYRDPREYVLTWLLCRIAIGLRQQIIQCYT
jgi:hypothetical protein